MAETNLKTYLYYTLFVLFVFGCIFFLIQEFSESSNQTLTNDYADNTSTIIKTQIANQKTATENITNDALKTTSDSDSSDITGSWLIGGFQRIRTIIGGTNKLTNSIFDVMHQLFKFFKLPPFLEAIAYMFVVVALLLIILAIIIERQGVTK